MFVVSVPALKIAATIVVLLASVGAASIVTVRALRPVDQPGKTMQAASLPDARGSAVGPTAAKPQSGDASPPIASASAGANGPSTSAAESSPPAPPPKAAPSAGTNQQQALKPTFDIVRVERSGEMVVAGVSAPGATVELLVDGRKFDRVVADLSGHWAMVPKPLQPGSFELSLRSNTSEGVPAQSAKSVTVYVPAAQGGEVLVTLNDPEAPTTVLQSGVPQRLEPKRPAESARRSVSIATAEADDTGRFFASGEAAKGSIVRLYLNDSYIATARAGEQERWSFTIQRGLSAGTYTVRVDDIAVPDGQVLSRAEVTFALAAVAPQPSRPANAIAASPTRPSLPLASITPAQEAAAPGSTLSPLLDTPQSTPMTKVPSSTIPANPPQMASAPQIPAETKTTIVPAFPDAAAPSPGLGAPQPESAPARSAVVQTPAPLDPRAIVSGAEPVVPAQTPADVVISDIRSAIVRRGDSLWRISRRIYGKGVRYTAIFQANTDQIRDPRRIYPGQVFVVPNENAVLVR